MKRKKLLKICKSIFDAKKHFNMDVLFDDVEKRIHRSLSSIEMGIISGELEAGESK